MQAKFNLFLQCVPVYLPVPVYFVLKVNETVVKITINKVDQKRQKHVH